MTDLIHSGIRLMMLHHMREKYSKTQRTRKVQHKLDKVKEDDSAFLNKSKKFNFEQAKVLFNRKKEDEDEIDLWKGEVITILSKNDEHVWIGLKEDKQKGFFPSEFVQIVNPIKQNNESNPQED
jgi:predicted nucleic acid-binding protein